MQNTSEVVAFWADMVKIVLMLLLAGELSLSLICFPALGNEFGLGH
jgi:hypothetical protein